MNIALLSIVMDIVIVILLAGTIYYAYSLARQLKIFRQSKGEFEALLMQLTGQINTAHDAIEHMQEAADTNGQVLNKLIRDGQFLADELQMVNEASNNLANRLERAASSGRSESINIDEAEDYVPPVQGRTKSSPQPSAKPSEGKTPMSGFAIRDREVEDDDAGSDGSFLVDDDDEDVGNFHSQAERELYTALKRKS
jgi:chromosome segregation ATPase